MESVNTVLSKLKAQQHLPAPFKWINKMMFDYLNNLD